MVLVVNAHPRRSSNPAGPLYQFLACLGNKPTFLKELQKDGIRQQRLQQNVALIEARDREEQECAWLQLQPPIRTEGLHLGQEHSGDTPGSEEHRHGVGRSFGGAFGSATSPAQKVAPQTPYTPPEADRVESWTPKASNLRGS